MRIRGFYFITCNMAGCGDLCGVRSALAAGVTVVQYRDKNASSRRMYQTALALKRACKNALFLVNDRIDIALAVNADGVHLGQDDMPILSARALLGKRKVIGISVSTMRQACAAVACGADYLGVGPIYATLTKTDAGRPTGVGLIKKIKDRFDIPVVAIGGISLDNAQTVIAAGADSLCAISAVAAETGIGSRIKKFQELFGAEK